MEDDLDSPFALAAVRLAACTGVECIATALGGVTCWVVEVEVAIGCPRSSLVLPITALKGLFCLEVGSIMLKGHQRSDQVTSVQLPTAL